MKEVKRIWPIVAGWAARRMIWDASAWAYLFSAAKSLDFGKSIFWIWLAYELGCVHYGLFTATKPTALNE